ncbi:putative MFS transporter superfamily [Dioscorea sansibarensis]
MTDHHYVCTSSIYSYKAKVLFIELVLRKVMTELQSSSQTPEKLTWDAISKQEMVVEDVVFKEQEMMKPDIDGVPEQLERAREAYKEHAKVEDPPTTAELIGWYLYGLSTYFVQMVLVPVLFPLIVAQVASPTAGVPPSLTHTSRNIQCAKQEMLLYQVLVDDSIRVHASKFSPLRWVAVSWSVAILVTFPLIVHTAHHLDSGRGWSPTLMLMCTAIIGPLSCLLTGFFQTTWLFPIYIILVVLASTIGASVHGRNLGLIVHGLVSHSHINKQPFQWRKSKTSWLSSAMTALGCIGAMTIAAFTYHMLRRDDALTSLWVVSIFSGLLWILGISHAFLTKRPGVSSQSSSPWLCFLSISKYPHAIGGLASTFFSSFSSSCIFAATILFVVGSLCIKPLILLAMWLLYFTVPTVTLPLLHPVLQSLIKTDAVRMQLLGLFMSALSSGIGFYFRDDNWHEAHILMVALLQGGAVGVLHAFGQVLVTDCSPRGKEGAFSAWHAWLRAAGACVGFTVAAVFPGNVGTAFGLSFLSIILGALVLVFGNTSHWRGAVSAGHVKEIQETASPVNGLSICP